MHPVPGNHLEILRLQRAFNARAAKFDDHAWLHQETACRLLEHLAPLTLEPARLLELGSGTGDLGRELSRQFRSSRIYSFDFALEMLRHARGKSSRWFSRQAFVCADAGQLCLAADSVQLTCANLLLPWVADVPRVLREMHRVLEPGGVLMLSTLGPQTLQQLREAYQQVDNAVHINSFMDMHDLGDALTGSGFNDVVVDVERITAHYGSFKALLREVQSMGAGNANSGRRRGLMGRESLLRLEQSYEIYRQGGRYPLGFELVFAQAWKPTPGGSAVEVRWREPD